MNPSGIRSILVAGIVAFCVASAHSIIQAEKDPHRRGCTSARCRKIRSFLRANYCGDSPFGNGSGDDGCEIKRIEKPQVHVDVLADYGCEWNESERAAHCEQHGQPSPAVRDILVGELHRLGLPENANAQIYFTVWKSAHSGWSVAAAYYSHTVGSEIELCEVVVIIDENSHEVVLRKLPFQKTDIDVPAVPLWAPLDIADVEGDGHEDVILEGDVYENHWLEVVSVHDGVIQTIFSGLGYYL